MRALCSLIVVVLFTSHARAADLTEQDPEVLRLSLSTIMVKGKHLPDEARKSRDFNINLGSKTHLLRVGMWVRYANTTIPGDEKPLLARITMMLNDYEIYAVTPKLYFLNITDRDQDEKQVSDTKGLSFKLEGNKLYIYSKDEEQHSSLILNSYYLRFSAEVILTRKSFRSVKEKGALPSNNNSATTTYLNVYESWDNESNSSIYCPLHGYTSNL
jgi:hypothetical protein